jgi:protein-disulfide isomerase
LVALTKLQDLRGRYLVVLTLATALAAILAAANQIGAHDAAAGRDAAAPSTSASKPVAQRSLFAGIEQHGPALGSPKAPVTLVECADLQCPYCALWARRALPTLVERYVRTGKLRIVFHGLAFIGPDSEKALRTAYATGAENHLWDVVDGLYARQGGENGGWVSDALVGDVAAGIAGLDGGRLLTSRWSSSVERQIEHAAAAAQKAGVRGTPSFQVGPTNGRLELVEVSSLDARGLIPAVEAALAQ